MKAKYDKYIKIYKDYNKFKENKRFVWSRYYFDDYQFEKRVNFVLDLMRDFERKEFVMEVQFWEENHKINDFFKKAKNSFKVIREYNNEEEPGIIVIEDYCLDVHFFEQLLQNHYNFELAYEPALSVKVLLFINDDKKVIIFDFYDDRGFIINYYYYK